MSSSSSSSSSSDDSSSSSSEEEQQTKSTTKPMKGLLNDDSDSDSDNNDTDTKLQPSLKINTKFAKEYESKKRREELTKHRHLSSHANNSDDSSSSSSSSESEDEQGNLLTPQLDVQILQTLQAIKSGNEDVYDRSVNFFNNDGRQVKDGGDSEESGSGDDEESGKKEREEKHKPKRYKDVVREQILQQMNDEDEEGDTKSKPNINSADGEQHNSLAYDEEQRQLRNAFLNNDNNSDNSDNSGDEDEWTKPKAKRNIQLDVEDDMAHKLWLEEYQKSTNTNGNGIGGSGGSGGNGGSSEKGEGSKGSEKLIDPKGEINNPDQFLMEFMTNRRWMDDDTNKKLGSANNNNYSNGGRDEDEEDSLDDLEKMDEFESKYNFRFEEANNNNMAGGGQESGASHSIVHYARSSSNTNTSTTNKTLRRTDQSRKLKRLERKERKAAERKAKEEQLKRLKNAKREELEGRLEQVRNVLGYKHQQQYDTTTTTTLADNNDELQHPGTELGLGIQEEEMILKLMEGDYDPIKFEQVMNTAYGNEYYEKEDDVWKNDVDVKTDLLSSDVKDVVVDTFDNNDEEGEGGEGDEGQEEDYGEEDYYDEDEQQWEEEQYNNDNNEESQMDKKLKSKMFDELYKLDYEDIIGDMPTRFKYRKVEANNYGLSTEEVLFARDTTLKQFVSLKKMAPYRDEEEYLPGTKRRKKFRQMLKEEKMEMNVKEEEGKKSGGDGTSDGKDGDENTATAGDDGKKKKRRRQKKNGKGRVAVKAAAAAADNDGTKKDDNQEVKVSDKVDSPLDTTEGEPEKKRRRRKKKSRDSNTSDTNVESGTASKEEISSTKQSSVAVEPVSKADTNQPVETAHKESKKTKKKKDKRKDGHNNSGKKRRKKSGVEGVSAARLSAYGF